MRRPTVLTATALAAVLSVAVATVPADAASIIDPDPVDPWYNSSSQSKNHGRILKTQDVTGYVGTKGYKSYRIQFTTLTRLGNPGTGSALVQVPIKKTKNRHRVMVNNYYLNALTPGCAPSFFFQQGSPKLARHVQWKAQGVEHKHSYETVYPQRNGYTLLLPDFLGPQSKYGANQLTSHIILDSMLALTRSGKRFTDTPGKYRFAMQGFSGGAMATEAALINMNSYAPALNKKLVVGLMGGTPASPWAMTKPFKKGADYIYRNAREPQVAVVLMYGIGLARDYPKLAKRFTNSLTPRGRKIVSRVSNMCITEATSYITAQKVALADITNVNWFLDKDMARISGAESLTTWKGLPPKGPHYYSYFGAVDNMVPVGPQKAIMGKWRKNGRWVQEFTVPAADHIGAQPAAVGTVMNIVDREMAVRGY